MELVKKHTSNSSLDAHQIWPKLVSTLKMCNIIARVPVQGADLSQGAHRAAA